MRHPSSRRKRPPLPTVDSRRDSRYEAHPPTAGRRKRQRGSDHSGSGSGSGTRSPPVVVSPPIMFVGVRGAKVETRLNPGVSLEAAGIDYKGEGIASNEGWYVKRSYSSRSAR